MTNNSLVLTVTLNSAIDIILRMKVIDLNKITNFNSSNRESGGKGINISKALNRLSITNIATGFLPEKGADEFISYLKKENIKEYFFRINFGKIRENYKLIEISSGKLTELNEEGPNFYQVNLDILENFLIHYDNLLERVKAVIISGSLPKGISNDFYNILINKAVIKGLIIGFDSSKEPLSVVLSSNQLPNIIHVNKVELEEIGIKFSVDNLYRFLEKTNLEWLVVTDGDSFGLALSKTAIIKFIPPKIDIDSTVACGDALLAALIKGRLNKENFEETLRFAIAFASATATVSGSGVADINQAEKLVSKVTLFQIK